MKEIYDELKRLQKPDGTLELSATIADGVFGACLRTFDVDKLTLAGAAIDLAADNLRLSGTVELGMPQGTFSCDVKMSRSVDSIITEALFVMANKISFADFFGYLSPMSVIVNRESVETESELGGLMLNNPKLSYRSNYMPELWLEADFSVPGAGQWSEYPFLTGAQGKLSGEVNIRSGFCEFDLSAALADVQIKPSVRINLLLRNNVMLSDARSAAGFEVVLEFEGLSPISFVTDLFQGKDYWWLHTSFADGMGAFDISNFFVRLFGVGDSGSLLLPPNSPINNFKLYELTFGMDYKDKNGLSMQYIRAYLATAEAWNLPLNFLTIDYLRLMWEMQWGRDEGNGRPYLFTGQIAASLTLNLPSNMKLTLSGHANIPDMQIEAHLKLNRDEPHTVGDIIGSAAASLPDSGAGGIRLAALDLWADCKQRELSLYAELQVGSVLNFNLGNLNIALARLYAGADFSQSGNTYLLGGEIDFGGNDGFSLALEGKYASPKEGDSYWTFRGSLSRGAVSLGTLIRQMLQIDPGSGPRFDIVLSEFDISYETLKKGFTLTAAFHAEWGEVFSGVDFSAMGKVHLQSANGQNTLSVLLALKIAPFAASLQIDGFPAAPQYAFRFAYREHALSANYSSVDKTLTARFENVSLGDVISFMVEFVNPNRAVKFPPPWDFLNKIDLSKFFFVYNFDTKALGIEYSIGLNIIGLFKLESIGLTYTQDSRVMFRLATDKAGINKAYEWDLLESNTPGMADTQNKFKLHYLAIAQHFSDDKEKLLQMNSIKDAVDYLAEDSTLLTYSNSANWLFAADFTINDVFRARAILLDPHLYGIAITIDGRKPPFDSFDGLMLELLYKKITGNVGMFKATLVLPQKYRRFSVGYATLTIGRMSIEIYTNGDFKIDMGFPHNRDFSQSFALEFGIFSGSGGFYFGLLSGLTCPDLPAVSGGYYAPVIQLGIGLSIGIGRSFDIGIVSAGFSLQAVGIFEGIMAFYNEDPRAVTAVNSLYSIDGTPVYFRAKAVLGLTGRVYVKVDLCIVTLSATVEFKAFAQVLFETHKPTLIDLDLELTLQASIKILFITIDFEYHLKFHKQIEISGSNRVLPRANNLCFYAADSKAMLKLNIFPYFSMREAQGAAHEHVLAFLPVMDKDNFATLVSLITDWVKASPESGDIDYTAIDEFLTANVDIALQIRTESDSGEVSGVVFAMPPPLELWLSDSSGNELAHREYWKDNKIPNDYIVQLRKYFNTFDLEESPDATALVWNGEKPIAEVIFTDYFNMLLRHITKTIKQDGNDTVNADELAAMVSRFMLQGLRLPEKTGSATRGLYDAIGQQIPFTYDGGGITLKVKSGQGNVEWLAGESSAAFTGTQVAEMLPNLSFSWLNRFSVRPMERFMLTPRLCPVREQLKLGERVLYRLNGDISKFKAAVLRLDGSDTIVDCDFGVLLPLEIRQTGNDDLFRVIGLDPTDRAKLIPLFQAGVKTYKLLYSPAPMDGIANTLIDLFAGKNDRLIKQNLTRETRMFAADSAGDNDTSFYVSDLESADFLRLLWQCSVVCGGYHLFLKPMEKSRVPKNIFDDEGKARLLLFAATADKTLVNCALSQNAAAVEQEATLYDTVAEEYRPTLAPGCFGAELTLDHTNCDGAFSVLGYAVSGQQTLSRPLVPIKTGDDSHWHYAPVWPLHKLCGSHNPYDAKPASFTFRLRDVLGNFVAGSCDYTAVPDVSDFVVGANEWAGTRLMWQATGKEQIKVTISCPELLKPANTDSINIVYRALLQTDQKGYRVSVNGHAFGSVKTYLEQLLAHMENPVQRSAPADISITFRHILDAISPLEFSLVVEREADTDIEPAKRAVSRVTPNTVDGLPKFAVEFEAAFPSHKLSRTGAEPEEFFAVRTGGDSGLSVAVSPYHRDGRKFPTYYAFRPLCNSPVTRDCEVTPWGGTSERRVFANIDIEVWARHILEDIDLLLSSGFDASMALCPELAELIRIKELFAQKISRQLIPIEQNAPNASEQQKETVQAWVLEHLRTSLSGGYDISSVAQYHAKLTADRPARLTLNAGGNGEVSVFAGKADTECDVLCVGYRFASRYRTGLTPKHIVKVEHLELDIADIDDGYQSSSWLQLLRPLENLDISFESDLPIPNPLRQIPEKSQLIKHTSTPGVSCHEWDYHFVAKTAAVEQDVLSIEVLFDDKQIDRASNSDDLFAAMARYETVRLPLLKAMSDDPAKHLSAFNQYAKAIAERWGENVSMTSLLNSAEVLSFELAMKFEDDKIKLIPGGYDTSKWTIEAEALKKDINPGEVLEFEVIVRNLPLYTKNVAHPKLRCKRNANLLDGLKVDDAFIYETEEVMLPPLYASIELENIFCGTVRGFDYDSILKAQSLAAQTLGFEASDCKADIVVRYQYGFSGSIIRLPVCMFLDVNIGKFADAENIVEAVMNWRDKINPISDQAALEFQFKVSTGDRALARFADVRVGIRGESLVCCQIT